MDARDRKRQTGRKRETERESHMRVFAPEDSDKQDREQAKEEFKLNIGIAGWSYLLTTVVKPTPVPTYATQCYGLLPLALESY